MLNFNILDKKIFYYFSSKKNKKSCNISYFKYKNKYNLILIICKNFNIKNKIKNRTSTIISLN